jgi:4-amino-4-deoxy-L-arabinose transferase-like glycosyltransferase
MGTDVRDWRRKETWFLGALVVASGFILFFNLWARSLQNHGYLKYAEIAREMIRLGDWVVPHYNGEIFVDKPPLLFWLIAIPSSIYGSVTPLLARLPSFFSAWVGVVVIFLWAKKAYGTNLSGLVAAGTLLSSYQYFFEARLAKTDMLLCCLILLALYCFYLGYGEASRRRYVLHGLSFLFMGLGGLTKGPTVAFLPFLVITVFLFKERRVKMLIGREFILGYLIFALTSLPWPLLFVHRVGFDQAVSVFKATSILTRKEPIYFYFLQIWVRFAPWSVLLPVLTIYLWRRRGEVLRGQDSFFLIWFVVFFVVLTLFSYRAARYLLPALPPLACLMGGTWNKKLTFFLIPFLLFVTVWHLAEMYWIRQDVFHTPGMFLAEELRPWAKEASLSAYQLDPGTLEVANFYLDRLIPVLKRPREVAEYLQGGRERLVLMPQEVYEIMAQKRIFPMAISKEFQYKGARLVLVSD